MNMELFYKLDSRLNEEYVIEKMIVSEQNVTALVIG